ncbi:putative ARM-1 protein variant 3 [Phlyctochytrium arcticum]|nr:putative ARM-1 protein variant 3 [Phlyctochytrium arcticum]
MASAAVSMFGTPAQRPSSALVEFKAGKCMQEGNTVTPDARKGLLYLNVADDSLLHFYWKDRRTGNVEDDLIIFPEEADFVKVNQSSGRVYVLKFKSSSQRIFFWMQEPKADKDEEFARRVNDAINNPPSGQENEFMSSMQQGESRFPDTTAATPESANTSAQLEQLRSILANIQVSSSSSAPANVTAEEVLPLLNNPEISAALFPTIPQVSHRSVEDVRALVQTSEFKQALQSVAAATRSGRLDSLQQQLAPNRDMEALQAFLQSLQRDS